MRSSVSMLLLGGAAAIAVFLATSGSSIPTSTADVVARFSVGSEPWAMAVSSRQQAAFVVDYRSSELTVVNLRTHSVRQIHLGSELLTDVAISPDQRELLVSSWSGTVYALNAATGALLGTVDVGSDSLAVDFSADGQQAYVLDKGINVVRVRDLKVVATIGTYDAPPYLMTLSPNAKTLYAESASGASNSGLPTLLQVVDLSSRKVTATLSQGYDQPCGLAMTPNGQFLYESYCEAAGWNKQIPLMRVVRLSTHTVVGTISVPGGSRGTVFSPNGRVAYTAMTSSDAVDEIDTATRSVIGQIVIPGASGSASLSVLDLSSSGRLLYALTSWPPPNHSPALVELKLPATN